MFLHAELHMLNFNVANSNVPSSGFINRADTGNLTKMAADLHLNCCFVCLSGPGQLFREKTTVLDVTQAAMLQTQPGNAIKRRRVESGWGMLAESISQHTKGLAIPWCVILILILFSLDI